MARMLVCGGAGYIGSHMVRLLHQQGHEVVVLDDLSTGHREAVKWGRLVEANLADSDALDALFSGTRFDAVFHFCARSLVAESVANPYDYYYNNVAVTLSLLSAMQRHGIDKIVFSSTAAVFGRPVTSLVDESHPLMPINPYGHTKMMVERVLSDAAHAYGLRSVSLRYFNAAGASSDGSIGEAHRCETHLIPNILNSVLAGGEALSVFGTDYETPDGTCIRDYVHVEDLASAHLLAYSFLESNGGAHRFNLGNGNGFSVLEVIAAAGEVAGRKIPFRTMPRREGDPAILVASSVAASTVLGWRPEWTGLSSIIESAWRWHSDPAF